MDNRTFISYTWLTKSLTKPEQHKPVRRVQTLEQQLLMLKVMQLKKKQNYELVQDNVFIQLLNKANDIS
jgi:hypothetical protein